jgi:hypothetical protein
MVFATSQRAYIGDVRMLVRSNALERIEVGWR